MTANHPEIIRIFATMSKYRNVTDIVSFLIIKHWPWYEHQLRWNRKIHHIFILWYFVKNFKIKLDILLNFLTTFQNPTFFIIFDKIKITFKLWIFCIKKYSELVEIIIRYINKRHLWIKQDTLSTHTDPQLLFLHINSLQPHSPWSSIHTLYTINISILNKCFFIIIAK